MNEQCLEAVITDIDERLTRLEKALENLNQRTTKLDELHELPQVHDWDAGS